MYQVHVDAPEKIMNLSESTLKNIRQEGCFIRRMLPDKKTVECVAIQDGYIFKCPRKLLIHVQSMKKDIEDLYQQTSHRCGCGIKDCDINSLVVGDTLAKMGIKVPKHKRLKDPKHATRYIKNMRKGTELNVNTVHTCMLTSCRHAFIITHTHTIHCHA